MAVVIACSVGRCDSSRVTVAPPPPAVGGVAFGASQVWDQLGTPATAGIRLAQNGWLPSEVPTRLASAKQTARKVVLNLPAGSHALFMTNGVFDHAKYSAALQTYNTTAVKAAVATATTDGTLLGINVMDEPHTCGAGDGNTWGPCGTLTKARVDSLCGEVKAVFPTTPVGVTHQHTLFDLSHDYRVCEFLIDQYKYTLGNMTAWRDGGLAWAKRQNMVLLFGANWLGGGVPDRDGVWDCRDQGGYLGQYAPLCQMTPGQVDETGRVLGPWGCGFRGWRWDDADLRDYQPTLANVSAYLAGQQGRPCSVR